MLGGFTRDQRPTPQGNPTDVLTGRCPTCGSVVEVPRSAATPPNPQNSFTRSTAEQGGFGAWFELWSVECPVCVAATCKVTGVDGQAKQERIGPRVYLTKKG